MTVLGVVPAKTNPSPWMRHNYGVVPGETSTGDFYRTGWFNENTEKIIKNIKKT